YKGVMPRMSRMTTSLALFSSATRADRMARSSAADSREVGADFSVAMFKGPPFAGGFRSRRSAGARRGAPARWQALSPLVTSWPEPIRAVATTPRLCVYGANAAPIAPGDGRRAPSGIIPYAGGAVKRPGEKNGSYFWDTRPRGKFAVRGRDSPGRLPYF